MYSLTAISWGILDHSTLLPKPILGPLELYLLPILSFRQCCIKQNIFRLEFNEVKKILALKSILGLFWPWGHNLGKLNINNLAVKSNNSAFWPWLQILAFLARNHWNHNLALKLNILYKCIWVTIFEDIENISKLEWPTCLCDITLVADLKKFWKWG